MRKFKVNLTPVQKSERRKDRLLLILSGVLVGISFPPFPFPFPLFLFFAFIPFFLVIEKKKTLLVINQSSYLTFFVLSVLTIYWVGSWQSKADTFLMIGGGVLIFFYPAVLLINMTLYYLSSKIFNRKISIWFFPLFWITGEYLLTLTDLKFPWLTLGHGLVKFTSFIQIADIIGAFGLSIIVLYINLCLYKAAVSFKENIHRSIRFISIAVLIFVLVEVYGAIKISNYQPAENKIKMGIIQPNLDPWDKWELGGLNEILKTYITLSQQCVNEGAKIIVWPETALPVYLLSGTYSQEVESIYSFLKKNNVSLLTGMPDYQIYFQDAPQNAKYSEAGKYYYATFNSVLLLQPGMTEVQRYGKMNLVPLGEKTPFVDAFPFLGKMLKWGVGISGWNVGRDTTVFQLKVDDDTIKVGAVVCYESIFPIFITQFVKRGAQFITVVTNDSWYGKSSGPYQHKEFAALRAVENRRAVVRCANGGISCLINKFGVTEVETEMFTRTHLVVDVSLNDEQTFYTKNPLIIPVSSAAFSLLIFVINILIWMRKKFKL